MPQRRRLQIALAAEFGAAALIGRFLFHWTWPAAAATAPVLAGALIALVLCAEFAIGAILDTGSASSGVPVLSAWTSEIRAHLSAFWWRQPFRTPGQAADIFTAGPRPAILLVAGFGCTSAMWLPLLESGLLARAAVEAVDLDPPCAPIGSHASRLDLAVRRLRARSGAARVAVIAHSMGGLAILEYLRQFGDGSIGPVVTIATPFCGAWAARWLPCPAGRQMRTRSPWLDSLAVGVPAPLRERLLCVASRQDNIVIPRASAILDGARPLWLDGVGHLALASDPRVWQAAIDHACTSHGQADAALR